MTEGEPLAVTPAGLDALAGRKTAPIDLVSPVRLSIPALLREWDVSPFEHAVWNIDSPVTREEVAQVILDGSHALVADDPWDGRRPSAFEALSERSELQPLERRYHVRRIAHFVVNGWTDKISVDVGCPALNFHISWPIEDGNHRFAAAIYRGDPDILAGVSGQTSWIKTFLATSRHP